MDTTTGILDNYQGENIRAILKQFHDNGCFLSAQHPFAVRVAERVYGRSKRIRHKLAIINSRRWRKS